MLPMYAFIEKSSTGSFSFSYGTLPEPATGWNFVLSAVYFGALIGLLTGIGFTMSIFIAMLAFHDPQQVADAKLGVLAGSTIAAVCGLAWGAVYGRRAQRPATTDAN